MIEKTVADWHKHLRGQLEGGLDALLAEDCVFYSPIVFTPQKGKAITKMYLEAATFTLGDAEADDRGAPVMSPPSGGSKFGYIKETLADPHAFLEFESELEGKYINGVDIITCNAEGRIAEFKVMVRPLQAVNLLHQKMAAMLEKMKG